MFVVFGVLPGASAQTNDSADLLSWWDHSFNLRTGAGYNDNLLLSRSNREQSPSFNGGLDFTLFRLPLDGKQFTLFLSSDYTWYPQGDQVDYESFALALARFKFDLGPSWHPGIDFQYFYQDQVIDASITDTNTGPLLVRGHALNLRPSVRHDFGERSWWEGSLGLSRQLYQQPLDDYWEGGPQMTLGYDYGFRSSVSLSYRWTRREYDTREETTDDGLGLPETKLRFQQHEMEVALHHNFDQERHWRSILKFGLLSNEDSGRGYFDFVRFQISPQLRYVAKKWEIKAQAKFATYDFSSQEAMPGSSSSRRKDLISSSLRGERKLSAQVKVFVEYAFERSVPNRRTDEYQSQKAAAGVDWEF